MGLRFLVAIALYGSAMGDAYGARLLFSHPEKEYVIIQVNKGEQRAKPAEFCFFKASGTKVGCGKVLLFRGGKAVVSVSNAVKKRLKKGMPAVRASQEEVAAADLDKVLQRFGPKAPKSAEENPVAKSEPSGIWEFGGTVAVQGRGFPKEPLYKDQTENQAAFWFQPSIRYRNVDETHYFNVIPYYRHDSHDNRRTLADIREMEWIGVGQKSELRLGVRRVFWGVTESQHLVDVINQTDFVGNYEGDEKLGQPMVNFAWFEDWGTLDFFVLPFFRERPLAGDESRLRGPISLDDASILYESKERDKHVDWAMRYAASFAGLDLGLTYFAGTNREPDFLVMVDGLGTPTFRPYYKLMHQTGLDLQWALDGWLVKAEAINRNQDPEAFQAWVYGVEYGFNGVAGTAMDLSLIVEHNRNSRNLAGGALQNDLFVGSRLAVNNLSSLEFVGGVIADLHYDTQVYSLEGSRRIADHWKLSILGRGFANVDKKDEALYMLRNDDYLQVELAYFY